MNEIKKCPFCGGKPVIKQSNERVNHYINHETVFSVTYELICPTCGVNFGLAVSEYKPDEHGQIKRVKDGYKLLVGRWNKRVEEPQEQILSDLNNDKE